MNFMFYAECGLALAGITIMVRGRFGVGKLQIQQPIAYLVAILVLLPLPICVLAGLLSGVIDIGGQMPRWPWERAPDAIAGKFFWVEPAVTGFCLLMAISTSAVTLLYGDDEDQPDARLYPAREGFAHDALKGQEGLDALAALLPPPRVVGLGRPEFVHLPCPVAPPPSGHGMAAIAVGVLILAGSLLVPSSDLIFIVLGNAIGVLVIGLGVYLLPRNNDETAGPKFAYVVYPDSLALLEDGTWTIAPFADVVEFLGPHPGSHTGTVEMKDGRQLVLRPNTAGAATLCKEVERRVFNRMLPGVLAVAGQGEAIPFGPLTVSRASLEYGGQKLLWGEVAALDVAAPNAGEADADGAPTTAEPESPVYLYISSRAGMAARPWCREPLLPLPNRSVLLGLLLNLKPKRLNMAVTPMLAMYMPELF